MIDWRRDKLLEFLMYNCFHFSLNFALRSLVEVNHITHHYEISYPNNINRRSDCRSFSEDRCKTQNINQASTPV